MKNTLILSLPPAVTGVQKTRLDAVTAMPDDCIDYSDAQHLSDAAWVKVAELPEVKDLLRPHVLDNSLDDGYTAMSSDKAREVEAMEWCHALSKDMPRLIAEPSYPWLRQT